MIDDVPVTARKALAYWLTLGKLGFRNEESQVLIVGTEQLRDDERCMVPNPGDIFLCVVVSQFECIGHVIVAGSIARSWWDGDGHEHLSAAWNALDQDEREHEWRQWVTPDLFNAIAAELIACGTLVPGSPSAILGRAARIMRGQERHGA